MNVFEMKKEDFEKVPAMNKERCELCAFFARLSHNFHSRNGFEETNCCVLHPLTQNKLWVIETTPCDRCEAFKKKEIVHE